MPVSRCRRIRTGASVDGDARIGPGRTGVKRPVNAAVISHRGLDGGRIGDGDGAPVGRMHEGGSGDVGEGIAEVGGAEDDRRRRTRCQKGRHHRPRRRHRAPQPRRDSAPRDPRLSVVGGHVELSVGVPRRAGCGDLILPGCGRFDSGECVGSGGGGAQDPGCSEVGGGVDETASTRNNRALVLSGRG